MVALSKLSGRIRRAIGKMGRCFGLAAAASALALSFIPSQADAFDRRQNAPGEFDFYVLALSWSPSFCAAASERGQTGRSTQAQCSGRPYSFVVHGLWPQYERGFPGYCQQPAPRLDRRVMTSMLDLMPAAGLIYSQWDKHGTCSGLQARAYFETVRKARAGVKIPDEFVDLQAPRIVSPDVVEAAFMRVNPGMPPAAISVTCDRTRLSEVRICMTKDLRFRECEEVERRTCKRKTVLMPPMRGG